MGTLTMNPPSSCRFERHVGFDNLPVGEATKNNPSSLSLQARHQGYRASRRSRTFMIGVDEHNYSQYALVWLLNNMVDDGDEVICVRVLEGPVRLDKNYLEDAKKLLETIMSKNELNKAISITLEYSVGKLHDTFQQLVRLPPLDSCGVLGEYDADGETSSRSTTHQCSWSAPRDGRWEEFRG